jgi:5-methylcytosine-specific restriction endonuclease McrA
MGGLGGLRGRQKTIAILGTRQCGRCFYCDAPLGDDVTQDHVWPLALGGGNNLANKSGRLFALQSREG